GCGLVLPRLLGDDAAPAEAVIGLVADGVGKRDQLAVGQVIVAARLATGFELERLVQAGIVGGGDDAAVGVERQHAGALPFLRAERGLVGDNAVALLVPVEDDAQHAERGAVDMALVADRGGVDRHRLVVVAGAAADVVDHVVVAAA